jgi:hypothetical protein
VNSRTPPVYRRLKPAVNTTRAWLAAIGLIVSLTRLECRDDLRRRHR